jgi:hypothetical protein
MNRLSGPRKTAKLSESTNHQLHTLSLPVQPEWECSP